MTTARSRSYATPNTAHGPEARAQLAAIAQVQAACPSRGHVDEAVDAPDEPHVSESDGDHAAAVYEDSMDRQRRRFER